VYDDPMLPESLRDLLRQEIKPGERVRWAGRPQPPSSAPSLSYLVAVVGVPEVAFAVFWIWTSLTLGAQVPLAGANLVFAAFGVPLLMMGLALLLCPWWSQRKLARAAGNTLYVVADQRAIVFNGGFYGAFGLGAFAFGMFHSRKQGIAVRSFEPAALQPIERVERTDGTGDVLFGAVRTQRRGRNHVTLPRDGFYCVADAKWAEELLRQLAATAD